MKDDQTIPTIQPKPEPINENDPFLNKKIGVAMRVDEWTFLMGFLHHCLTDEETIKALFDTQEDYNELAFTLKQVQRQVFLIQDKIQKPEEESTMKKILQLPKRIIGLDGKPLT